MDDVSVERNGENLSNLEVSQKAAEDMLKKLGYENMEVIHTGQLVFVDDNKSWMDGYEFSFARSIGTMQIGFCEESTVLLPDSSDNGHEFGVQQEYIHVYVSDNNVYRVKIDNLVEIGDMLSEGEQNSLLSFDKIDSIAREFMENNVLLVSYMNVDFPDSHNIDSVSLKYLLLPFEEGKYALMPVWIYYLEQPDKFIDYKIDIICINAVDGSIIESEIPSEILVE